METFNCPACGAAIVGGITMCSVCKSGIDWQSGQSVMASAEGAFRLVVIVILIAVLAAALVLTVILLAIS